MWRFCAPRLAMKILSPGVFTVQRQGRKTGALARARRQSSARERQMSRSPRCGTSLRKQATRRAFLSNRRHYSAFGKARRRRAKKTAQWRALAPVSQPKYVRFEWKKVLREVRKTAVKKMNTAVYTSEKSVSRERAKTRFFRLSLFRI